MGYLESTLTGEEEIEFKFEFHWSIWTVPTIGVILAPDTAGLTLVFAIFSALSIKFTEQGITTKKAVRKEGIIPAPATDNTKERSLFVQVVFLAFPRKTEELLLSKVETVEVKQGILGRILGYGNVQLTGAGSSYLILHTLPNPMEIKRNIESLVNNQQSKRQV
ncbi:MAG: hypothetical protein CMN58_06465 [Solibacterales bacterium]|nr:hypothetical protein [Bryobacterales bacterium]|tara:strand:+ start:8892 stop:9383 length:492 start_codon:yes stop_codon:yes gene_type:complete